MASSVAFKAGSTSLGGTAAILQYDSTGNTTTLVDTNGLGAFPDEDDRFGPETTPDGRFVAYVRREGGTGSPYSSVQVWDTLAGTNTLVSDDGSGVPSNTASDTPVISPDGRFVVFLSNATNLVANTVSNGFHIYLRDLLSGTTKLVDADTNSVGSTDMTGVVPSLSADGRIIAFSSPDGGLVGFDNNRAFDVLLRDTVSDSTVLVSRRAPTLFPVAANDFTSLTPYSVSADGHWVVFESEADDLIPNDTNGLSDVFVEGLQSGQITLVSVGLDGNPAIGGRSCNGLISADGTICCVPQRGDQCAGRRDQWHNEHLSPGSANRDDHSGQHDKRRGCRQR